MKKQIILPYFLFGIFLLQNCTTSPTPITLSTFKGEPEAIQKAEEMFIALGGKEVWANLKSLYIKALHEEPNLNHPYQSQIWRDLDNFKMRIEQRGPEFDVIGLFSDEMVEIQYLHRDSLRWFTKEALIAEKFSHEHNVYVLLKKLATLQDIEVKNGPEGRLEFFKKDTLLVAFGLDEQNRPHRFFQPNYDGSESASLFTKWNTIDGFTHPAGGGPSDGNFSYNTEIWKPSTQNIEEAFGVEYKSKPFALSNLNWLIGKWQKNGETSTRYEVWNEKDENTLIGEGYKLAKSDSTFLERLSITKNENGVFYNATVPNQNDGKTIPFKLLGYFENRAIFLNPNHDFPQKIVYENRKPDSLIVRVAGEIQEKWEEIEFGFEKLN